MKIVMSSGHGKYIRGASGPQPWGLDEVNEARRVVEQTATSLRDVGVEVITYHDDVSKTQSENLNRIVDYHNSRGAHDLDVSIHFNAYEVTNKPMGCEVLYLTQEKLAKQVVNSICRAAAFTNRGPKYRGDLAFLNNTAEPAILVETCFVDSHADVDIYGVMFNEICAAIAGGITGGAVQPGPEPSPGALFTATGKCSYFGGPDDTGVSPSEGLAFISDVMQAPHLFLPYQPDGTSGLARRLNPWVNYVACRWDYDTTSREMLRQKMALVRATHSGLTMSAFPADWGPHVDTGRVADLSPGLLDNLGIVTDDEVEVIFPEPDE